MTLEQLCADWLAAKAEERVANDKRIDIENQIVALTGKKDEGSKTHEAEGFKVTITGKVTRKMDWDAWAKVRDQIPVNLRPVKIKEELDERGVKYLADHEPAIYRMLPLTITPAKTAVEVKVAA